MITAVDRLETAARDGGGLVVFHLGAGPSRLEAAEAFEMATIRASRLREAGAGKATRVGVVGPNVPEWIAWAHAVWCVGATIVPLPIPLRIRDRTALAGRINALAAGFGCTLIAAHDRFVPMIDEGHVIAWDDIGTAADAMPSGELVRLGDDTLFMILPTSGSTAAPKGVSRTYEALANGGLRPYLNPSNQDEVRHLVYSPLTHGAGSSALYALWEPWLEYHVLPPERFARDPGELFRIVSRHRITSMGGTSSGIAAALRAIERDPVDVDLRSLTKLGLSAEMIDPAVVDRLASIGGQLGLQPGTVSAQYGLSEGGGTATDRGQPVRIDEVDLDALIVDGVARPPRQGAATKRVTSCGRPSRWDVLIVGPEGPVPDRHVGEVRFQGPELLQGYIGPGAEDAFDAEGWMHTGDVGYLAEGELFITGRIKEVLIQQGKKYHPEDIEWAAALGADVGPADCVAFTPLNGDAGDIVVAVSTPLRTGLDDLERRVRASVVNAVGITLRSVVFVEPESLPRTSSGKAQRLEARELHARGGLAVLT
ncbi:MAG: fatty-acyl-CoA synthase [Acidimicrobiaceae bacterium]